MDVSSWLFQITLGYTIYFHKFSVEMRENTRIVQGDKEERQNTRSVNHSPDSRARWRNRLARCILLAQAYPLLCKFRKHCSPAIKINPVEMRA